MWGHFFTDMVAVLFLGLLAGAGLPTVFAVGIASYAWGAGGDAETDHAAGHPIGRVIGIVCFAIVIAAIALGIAIIISSGFGYHVSFAHVFPEFVKK